MKLRSFFFFLAAIVLLLLLMGGGGWFWLISRSPLNLGSGKQAVPEAAIFVPRQAPVMVSLLVNPEQIAAGSHSLRSELSQFTSNLLASRGLDYAQDVQPWLGEEITFAVTTLDIDRQVAGQQPGYLVVAEASDLGQAEVCLERFWQKYLKGATPKSQQYQGVKLVWNPGPAAQVGNQVPTLTNPLATAQVGDRILFANDLKVLRNAINNVQSPDLGLASAKNYQRGLDNLQQSRIGFAFLNLPVLMGASARSATAPAYDSLAIGLGLNRQGMLAETALVPIGAEGEQAAPRLAIPVQALRYIPQQTSFVVAGANLEQLWQQVSAFRSGSDLISNLVNQFLNTAAADWHLDLPSDIFGWVKGEYAIAIIPHSLGTTADAATDWLFIAEASDPEVQSAVTYLDDLARQQGLGVSPLEVAQQQVLTWTELVTTAMSPRQQPNPDVLAAQVIGAHTTVDNYQVLATSLAAIAQALQAPKQSLLDSKTFTSAIAPLPTPNNGYVYLDWPASRLLLEQQFPVLRAVEAIGQPIFRHLRSLALSSYGTEAGVQRNQIFIRLT